MDLDLLSFAQEIGDASAGPVWIAGRQTRVPAPSGIRTVSAPSGIVDVQPEEMVVACGAATPVDELQAELARFGQYVNLPKRTDDSGTVGGALAQGTGDIYRLGRGSLRDTLLQVRYVDHDANVIKAGGPTVKNVSGFDLCRLMVGSRGVLGFMGEMILRTRPVPPSSRWFVLENSEYRIVEHLLQHIYRPASVLWNGTSVWFCIEGHPKDCDDTIRSLARDGIDPVESSGPPDSSRLTIRESIAPSKLERVGSTLTGEFLIEAGVGIVHRNSPGSPAKMDDRVVELHHRLLMEFNPSARLNPGVSLVG